MAQFSHEAKTADRGATSWTFVQDRNGDQLANTYLPFGSALPKGFNAPLVRQVMASRGPSSRTCSTARPASA